MPKARKVKVHIPVVNLNPEQELSLTALLVLREKIIRPLLAASCQPEPPSKPANPTPIDHHYESLRVGMRSIQ
jgi:hypothetical protein